MQVACGSSLFTRIVIFSELLRVSGFCTFIVLETTFLDNVAKPQCLCIKYCLLEFFSGFNPIQSNSADPQEVVSSLANPTLDPHAPGARMT